ncbi:MAG: T9SS type A sorting domain-containing protein [Bacteroidetes bacterium]|nr:T9SS type A sorting domain-containing protein [Bacteroidota bacterium]
MKTHTLLFSLLIAIFFSTQHAAAQQTIELPDSSRTYIYDTVNGGWGHLVAGTFWTWNAHNDVTSMAQRIWTGTQWTDSFDYQYTYDAQHHLTSELERRSVSTGWDSLYLDVYTYDASGTLTTRQSYGWQYGGIRYCSTYSYGSNPAQPLSMVVTSSTAGAAWQPSEQYTWSYQPPVDTMWRQRWDVPTSSWVYTDMNVDSPGHYRSYSYNATAWVLTSELYKGYDSHDNWIGDYSYVNGVQTWYKREAYTYNTAGQIITATAEYLQGGSWYLESRDSMVYDAAGRLTFRHDSVPSGVTQDSVYAYDSVGYTDYTLHMMYIPAWHPSGDSTQYYYHRSIATGLQNTVLAADIAVYPVPAHDQLIVALHTVALENITLTLTDMSGRKVMRAIVAEGTSHLDVSGLSAGVYTLSLFDGRGAGQVRRVVIR